MAALPGPDLNPIGPCSVKMWGPRPHINLLTLQVQKHSVDTCELYAILLLLSELSGDTAFCIRKPYVGL